jgi:hypothetical protein
MAQPAMTTDKKTLDRPQQAPSTLAVWLLLAAIFAAVQFASLFSPPLLDDVDSAHAQAAQHMVDTGDLITSKINGIRYIEKPPLPYWVVAASYKVFGENTFATHLPNTLAMLGLTWLSWLWARRAWGDRAGLYAGLAVITSIGPFLFTRFIIPEAELSFFLLVALYALITGLEDDRPNRFYAGARSSPSPARCSSCWSPRPGTSSAASTTSIRDTPSAITPPSATSTDSSTSISSTNTFSASSASVTRTTTTNCPASPTGCSISFGFSPGACSCPRLSSPPGRPATTGCSTCATKAAKLSISTSTTPSART